MLFKSLLQVTSLLWKLYIHTCWRWREIQRRFSFSRQKVQSEDSGLRLLCSSHHRGSTHSRTREKGPTRFVPQELHSPSLQPAAQTACEYLCFISISFVHLWARRVLKSAPSSCNILAYERFHRNALLSDSGKPVLHSLRLQLRNNGKKRRVERKTRMRWEKVESSI